MFFLFLRVLLVPRPRYLVTSSPSSLDVLSGESVLKIDGFLTSCTWHFVAER